MTKERVKKLNKRHKRFCDEYLKDFNATRAYKAIYPTAKDTTAATNGGKLLRNAQVSRYLASKLKRADIESVASLNDVLRAITDIALKKPRKTVFRQVDNTKDKNDSDYVLEDTTTIMQPSDKSQLKALEFLARYYNIFMNVETPELTKAKTDKAKAEAKMAQLQAKAMQKTDVSDDSVIIVDDIEEAMKRERNKSKDNQRD